MTVRDIDDVWGNGLTPVEIHAWEDGNVGDKVYWKGTVEGLWSSGYMDYSISDIFIDQLTCGLVISLPACDLKDYVHAVIYKHGNDDFTLWYPDILDSEREEIEQILEPYTNTGYSVRGTRKEIMEELS